MGFLFLLFIYAVLVNLYLVFPFIPYPVFITCYLLPLNMASLNLGDSDWIQMSTGQALMLFVLTHEILVCFHAYLYFVFELLYMNSTR
jgi:hypothetical protein